MRPLAFFFFIATATYASNSPTVERLQAQLNAARLERMRWEKVIQVQADLAQNPDKLAAAAEESANELRSEGRSMTVEGLTMGASGACEYAQKVIKDWRTVRKLEEAKTAIEATHKIFVEDQLNGTKATQNEGAAIAKAAAALKVMAQQAPHKEDREVITALIEIGTPTIQILSRAVREERPLSREDYAVIKDMVSGTRAMMLVYIKHRNPSEWIGYGKGIAKAFPAFGKFSQAIFEKGIPVANLLNAAAYSAFGAYAWKEGIEIEGISEDIKADQQHAAETLRKLLPHAQQAAESAAKREQVIADLIRAAQRNGAPPPPKIVPPVPRVMDDGLGVPPGIYAGLGSTESTLQQSPALTFHLTKNEIRRQEEIARAELAARKARERAERIAQERAERERRDAEERAAERRSARSSSRISSDHGSRNVGNVDRMNSVVHNVLSGW